MNQYQFKLEKYKGGKTRHVCPRCGMARKFTRYVRVETGEYVADHVGRCERIDTCRYHLSPGQYFAQQGGSDADAFRGAGSRSGVAPIRKAVTAVPAVVAVAPSDTVPRKVSYIPEDIYRRSHMHYADNHFVQYLYTLGVDCAIVNRKILEYRIGISDHWPGATIWWQVDRQQRVRTGKIMLYDRTTGRRVREPRAHVSWVHSVLGLEDFALQQCLFGEQLLAYDDSSPVAIVESEKSAVIASLYRPHVLWMATGGKELLTAEKLEPLRGRQVTLYPDAGAYELWSVKAREYRGVVPVQVSDLMERHSDRGADIADWLVRG